MHLFFSNIFKTLRSIKKIDKEEYEDIDNSKSFPIIVVLLSAGSIYSALLSWKTFTGSSILPQAELLLEHFMREASVEASPGSSHFPVA